jgi:hypothetical protein
MSFLGWRVLAQLMRARAVVALRFQDAAQARAIARATGIDNPPAYCKQNVEGRVLHFEAEGPSMESLRETLDDWLRCAGAAAQAAARGRRGGLPRL